MTSAATKPSLTEEPGQPLTSAAVPLIASLLVTGVAVLSICGLPRTHSLTWPGLFGYAICYVLIALLAHSIAMWAVCRGFQSQLEVSSRPLIIGLWMAVAWLPLLWLLIQEQSVWVAGVPPLIIGHGIVFFRRWLGSTEASEQKAPPGLFEIREEPSLLRAVAPAVLAALAVQAAIVLVVLGHPLASGSLLASGTVYPLWHVPLKMRVSTGARRRSVAIGTADVILLTAIALIPFLRSFILTGGLGGLFAHVARSGGARPPMPEVKAPGMDYSGIVLFVPAKPREKTTIPPPASLTSSPGSHTKPMVIPFDGAYWYFKAPDSRPKPNARVVKGDPIKANVHSTDYSPLAMEAHQMLGSPLHMDCCTAMRVAIRNGDNRIGAIDVELVLKQKGRAQSFGTLVLKSSMAPRIALDRPPVDETLTFTIPAGARGKQFDEIAVVIKGSHERSRAGAKLAIQEFTLVP
jgi:hypothetical protein